MFIKSKSGYDVTGNYHLFAAARGAVAYNVERDINGWIDGVTLFFTEDEIAEYLGETPQAWNEPARSVSRV